MALAWTPHQDSKGGMKAERQGRMLEIRKHIDGTWWLMVWKTPAASAVVGVFSDPVVAQGAAEIIPIDDVALAKMTAQPHAAFAAPNGGVQFR